MTNLETRPETTLSAPTTNRTAGTVALRRRKHPALPAFVGMIAIWLAIGAIAGRGLVETISAGIIIATFLVIVGIGQLFVITVGNGGIDLSVSYVMTLSAFLACQIMAGNDANIATGIIVAVIACVDPLVP